LYNQNILNKSESNESEGKGHQEFSINLPKNDEQNTRKLRRSTRNRGPPRVDDSLYKEYDEPILTQSRKNAKKKRSVKRNAKKEEDEEAK
jgi:hypothetical protein